MQWTKERDEVDGLYFIRHKDGYAIPVVVDTQANGRADQMGTWVYDMGSPPRLIELLVDVEWYGPIPIPPHPDGVWNRYCLLEDTSVPGDPLRIHPTG